MNTGTSASAITDDTLLGGPGAANGIGAGCQIRITTGTRQGDITQLASNPKLTTGVINLDPALGGQLNQRATTLNGAISATATSIVVASAANFPTIVPFYIIIETERLRVTAVSSTTYTVERGALNTVAATHADTTAVTLQDSYQVCHKPFSFTRPPNAMHDALDKVMRWFPWERRIVPLTMIPDGDMLADTDTDWTETNATDAKAAASFPLGLRTLRVTATSALGYVGTANIPVEPSASYYLEAMGMIASTGVAADAGTLILRDVTNSENFTLSESAISHFDPDILANNVSMSDDTEQVTIRLQADANGDVIDWGHVIFYKNGQQRFVLPDRPQRVLRIGELRVAPTAQPETRSWDRMTQIGYTAEQSDAGIWVLNLDRGLSGQAAYYEEFVQPALFTSDAATTAIPVEELAAVTAEALLRPLQRDPKWAARYQVAAYDAAVVRMKYQDANNVVVERGQQVVSRSYV